jgi:serine/threonine-protein kinase
MDVSTQGQGVFAFGRFRLDPVRRALLREEAPVKLSARLFDTLLYLVRNNDRLVAHHELEEALWGGRAVESGNLTKAISSLRRALQDEDPSATFIVTVPGRGYRFAVPVVLENDPTQSLSRELPARPQAHPPRATQWPLTQWRPRPVHICVAAAMILAASGAVIRTYHPAELARPPFVPPLADAGRVSPPLHSVAVMAFTNLSGDPAQEYFSDGISEELIDALGRIGAVRVAARLSSFSFKGKSETVSEIARKLNVGTVLEGSVRRDGARIRVTAQLIDGVTGFQLWSHSYDRQPGDIFHLQGEIAEAVASSLQVTLLGSDKARLTTGGTSNGAAFDADLRGVGLLMTSGTSENGASKALAAFDEAIRRDPNFALAHMHRCDAIGTFRLASAIHDLQYMRKLNRDALAECELAVSLAPDLAAAHADLGDSLMDTLDFRRAEFEVSRAIELAPGDSYVLGLYGKVEVDLGHVERGVAAARQAVALNPLAPREYGRLAWRLLAARQYDEALEALKHRQMLGGAASGFWSALTGYIEYFKGDAEAARRACSDESNWQENECLAFAYHALGRQKEADAQLAKLRAMMGDTRAMDYADIYAQWGDTEAALHWLETAYKLREPALAMIKTDPDLDPIRDAPRYKEIERQLNFPK